MSETASLRHPHQLSPIFAGRAEELARLAEGFEALGEPRQGEGRAHLVLVSAEAGGGKSRLVQEHLARIRGRALVLQGDCLDLSGAGLAYAPFIASLRSLLRQVPADEVRDLVSEWAAGELGRLVPELGSPAASPDPELSRSHLFAAVAALLEVLAAQARPGPLVLVLEDLHWADQPSRDLFAFVAHSLAAVPLQILVTYRHTDLDDRHPLRALFAELLRNGAVSLPLPRLTTDEVAHQMEGILGRIPDPAQVSAAHARSEGVPLFTEALVNADGTLRDTLDGSLSDLLLGAVRDLPDATMKVLGAMAVGGSRVGHELLQRVTGVDGDALTDLLRPADAARVVMADRDGYRFRHELIRESVEGDLLTGDRIKWHSAYAELLTAQPRLHRQGPVTAAVALHWRDAEQPPRALEAAWRAAGEAGAPGGNSAAYDVREHMLVLVLDTWDSAPDAVSSLGLDRVDVLAQALDAACWNVNPVLGEGLIDATIDALGEHPDPGRMAAVLLERASFRQQAARDGDLAAMRSAVEIAPDASLVRAEALGQLARRLLALGRTDEARELMSEFEAQVAAVGSLEYALEVEVATAMLAAAEGGDPADDLMSVLARTTTAGVVRVELLAHSALAETHEGCDRHEGAVIAARRGFDRAALLGLGRYAGGGCALTGARALTTLGRLDEALSLVDEALVLDPATSDRVPLLLVRASAALVRGDRATAVDVLDVVRELAPDPDAGFELATARVELDVALMDPDPVDVDGAVREAVDLLAARSLPVRDWFELCSLVARTAADRSLTLDLPEPTPSPRNRYDAALRQVTLAEIGRLSGPDPHTWDEIARTWATLGAPHHQAYALLRSAAAHAAQANRDATTASVHDAARLAGELGAEPLLEQLTVLARRARVDLDRHAGSRPHAPSATVPFTLTSRETDVLRLVTAGMSNGDIGTALFISPKTASVHVSNILAKLQVSTRGEAAALAHRLHLFEPA